MHVKAGDTKLIIKILFFVEEIKIEPKKGTGKPEQLKGFGERSIWSHRIDKKHRLTYEVFEERKEVVLLACYGHYEDN